MRSMKEINEHQKASRIWLQENVNDLTCIQIVITNSHVNDNGLRIQSARAFLINNDIPKEITETINSAIFRKLGAIRMNHIDRDIKKMLIDLIPGGFMFTILGEL